MDKTSKDIIDFEPVDYSASNKRAIKKLRRDIERTKRQRKMFASWGKKKLNRRNHAFRPGEILICLNRDSAKHLYKNEPGNIWGEWTWPEIGDVVVVADSFHYSVGSFKGKKGVRLLNFENFNLPQCICSYKYRRATVQEIKVFIRNTPSYYHVHQHAQAYLASLGIEPVYVEPSIPPRPAPLMETIVLKQNSERKFKRELTIEK